MEFPWKRNLYVLWLGVFFCSLAYSMAIPFLPLFLDRDLHVSAHLEAWSGVAFGITFLASALIAPYWGSLADKYGRRPMLLRSGFSLSAVYFLTYFVHNPYELMAVRVLQGLLAGYVPSSIALVATNTPEKEVGYALGVMSTAGATGGIIGPLIGGALASYFGYRPTFLISGVVVLVAAFIAWAFVKERPFDRSGARSRVRDDLREAAANRPLLKVLVLTMIMTGSVMVIEPLLTIYVLQLGASRDNASISSGIIFSAVGVATVLMAPRWGLIGGRIGFRRTLFIGLLGGGLGNLLQIVFHSLWGFGMLRFGYGLFFAAVYPSINALIVKATSPDFRGRAFSLNQSATQIGMMLGPMAGGGLGAWFSIPVVFVLNGMALIATAFAFRSTRGETPPAEPVQAVNQV